MDKAVILNVYRYKILKGLIRDYEYNEAEGWNYNKNLTLFFQNRNSMKEIFPDEILDKKMIKLPEAQLVNYAMKMDCDEDEELPEDLSLTESILTDVLWGKRDKNKAALLVAAIENMDLQDVLDEIENLGFY